MQVQAKTTLMRIGHSLVTWEWTKVTLYWIILSAGTASELAFLVASLWVTINASVHKFVLIFLSEQATSHFSELATVAYVGLPECILALAIVTTLGHFKTWLYSKNALSLVWSILYGLPTIVFLVISLITIGCSLLSVTFQLPDWMIVTRGLGGYFYGLIALLYTQLGKPQEADRLKAKDLSLSQLTQAKDIEIANLTQAIGGLKATIETLQKESNDRLLNLGNERDTLIAKMTQENRVSFEQITRQKDGLIADLTRKLDEQKAELEHTKTLFAETINEKLALEKAVNKSDEPAFEGYSQECVDWLKSGIKTVLSADITRFTGHSKRKIDAAINKGLLQVSPRNKELILVSSLQEWLKNIPPSIAKIESDTEPTLRIVSGD